MRLVRSVKRGLAWGLLRSGALSLKTTFGQSRRAVLLMYHRVNNEGDPFFPALSVREFEEQVDFLQRNYRIDNFEGVVEWLQSGAPGPPRAALTFDDGYPDTYDVVFPILRRRGLAGTLFLSTSPLASGEALWLDRLRALFKHATATVLECRGLGLGPWPLGTVEERLRILRRVIRALKKQGPTVIEDTLGELGARLGGNGAVPPGLLTWAQVEEMHRGGLHIGAHTHKHYILSRLSPEEARRDMATSVELISRKLGVAIRTFAYPNGSAADYTAQNRDALTELGITGACTTVYGYARPSDHPLELPRLHTASPTTPLFACRVAGLRGSDDDDADEAD